MSPLKIRRLFALVSVIMSFVGAQSALATKKPRPFSVKGTSTNSTGSDTQSWGSGSGSGGK